MLKFTYDGNALVSKSEIGISNACVLYSPLAMNEKILGNGPYPWTCGSEFCEPDSRLVKGEGFSEHASKVCSQLRQP
jgi:hypothetical protein